MTDLLTIGAFARMTRLTVTSLRHYDAEGLLPPARVDPVSGYRSYSVDQVPTAATIAVLRSVGVAIPAIRAVLAGDDRSRRALLDAERHRLEADLDRRRRALHTVARLVEEPLAMHYDIQVAPRVTTLLHAVRGQVRADALDADTGALCGRLADTLAVAHRSAGPFVAVFPLDLDQDMSVPVGIAADPAQPPGGLEPVELPGGEWASTLHVGAYAALPLAYSALLGGVSDRGRDAAGPVLETYLTDPTAVPEHELVTSVAVALR